MIAPDLKEFEWWHKPRQIKEARVPDPAAAAEWEQKLNSIVCQWLCVIALFRVAEAWLAIAGLQPERAWDLRHLAVTVPISAEVDF